MFESYVNRIFPDGEPSRMGEVLKSQSDFITESTWDRDISTLDCYMYDYKHDDEIGKLYGLNPKESPNKTHVLAKFIITQYNTISKDQVEYHLQFKPSQSPVLDYYEEDYCNKYGAEYPIGMYIDIPDRKGVYRKWIICRGAFDNQFASYSILPCNYTFKFVKNGYWYKMDGIERIRNSYNSGIYSAAYSTTVEDQDEFWLPINFASEELYFDDRVIISAPLKTPIVWSISKVISTKPLGMMKFVVSQDKYNETTDNKELLIADYYKSKVLPKEFKFEEEPSITPSNVKCVISLVGTPILKIGGSGKKINVSFTDLDGNNVDGIVAGYDYYINGEIVSNINVDSDGNESILDDDGSVLFISKKLSDLSIRLVCNNESMYNKTIKVVSYDSNNNSCCAEIEVEVGHL